jgi:hypothetical protein
MNLLWRATRVDFRVFQADFQKRDMFVRAFHRIVPD